MKITMINFLKAFDILARDIYSTDGNLLIKSGHQITDTDITALKKYNIRFVYIEDPDLDDIKPDTYLEDMKQSTLRHLPTAFAGIMCHDYKAIKASTLMIEGFVDYIYDTANIGVNLFELKAFDDYTYIHSIDTAIMSTFLGISFGMKKDTLKLLCEGAIFHDIGKIRIPDSIINKKGRLTAEEFEIIKKHPIYGREILEDADIISETILNTVSQHHEKADGSGYPYGLTDSEMSIFGKIVSLSDVFTAISAKRSYRDRFSPSEAYEYILSKNNVQFNPELVKKFRTTFAIYPKGCRVKLSNGIEGYVVGQNSNFPDRPVLRILYNHWTKKPIQPYEINLVDHTNVVIKSVI